MSEVTRTNLLNYLNNNKIEYSFDKVSQEIRVDLTVDEEDDVLGETCRNGKEWNRCNCC